MSELESMGKTLMEIALQYTHPKYEGMYPDWGAVCNIGEEIVRMSGQPQLDENQQDVLEWLKWSVEEQGNSPMDAVYLLVLGETLVSVSLAYIALTTDQQTQVLTVFSKEVAECKKKNIRHINEECSFMG